MTESQMQRLQCTGNLILSWVAEPNWCRIAFLLLAIANLVAAQVFLRREEKP